MNIQNLELTRIDKDHVEHECGHHESNEETNTLVCALDLDHRCTEVTAGEENGRLNQQLFQLFFLIIVIKSVHQIDRSETATFPSLAIRALNQQLFDRSRIGESIRVPDGEVKRSVS